MQRTLQLQHGTHVASKTAGRYLDILFIFRPPLAPAPGVLLSPRAARVRAVRATAVNKNNVSG
jgi:hypothetical protein